MYHHVLNCCATGGCISRRDAIKEYMFHWARKGSTDVVREKEGFMKNCSMMGDLHFWSHDLEHDRAFDVQVKSLFCTNRFPWVCTEPLFAAQAGGTERRLIR